MNLSRFRLKIVFLIVSIGFVCVSMRLFYLQLWCHPVLASRAKKQLERLKIERPLRGKILDRNGEVLVRSIELPSCFIDPTMVQDSEKASRYLSSYTDLTAEQLQQKIESRRSKGSAFLWISRQMELKDAQDIRRLSLPGVGFISEQVRFYPNGDLARYLLGKVGADYQGLTGIEYAWEKILSGTPKSRRILRDGKGNKMFNPEQESVDFEGGEVTLTIDRTLQYFAEHELKRGLYDSGSKKGMIIIQNPHTGEILAMASRSTQKELFTPSVSISEAFEPGSTLKIVAASAAIEEGIVRTNEIIDCENGSWEFNGLTIHDYSPHKKLSFSEVIEKSSNIGTAKIAIRLGPDRFFQYLRAFGFGTKSGVGLPGETRGLVRPVRKWSGVSLPMLSFGQEIAVNSLQLIGSYSVIANGGKLYEAKLIKGVRHPGGKFENYAPQLVRRVVSPQTAEALTKILIRAVNQGTGKRASLERWTVAGKTGTAQKADIVRGGYADGKYIVSFCGFVPARRPLLSIAVIYDEPEGTAQGGLQAAPVFQRLALKALGYLGVPSDRASFLSY